MALIAGFDPDDVSEFNETALMEAAESGATECAKILIDTGANIHLRKNGEAAIKIAVNLDIVRALVNAGADLNDISNEMRAALTGVQSEGALQVSHDDYLAGRDRRFGTTNPEKMNLPFWQAMIRSGMNGYAARQLFKDTSRYKSPVWCFQRFGKSINELPDGRIIEIAGEHEDYYDPDFCLYNDVVAHLGDGTFDIYGYPKECFEPTDFHTATLVGTYIYVIGTLGYRQERVIGETPVCRLNTESFVIERLMTTGQMPQHLHNHKAKLIGENLIHLTGGEILILEGDKEKIQTNTRGYFLDLETLTWHCDQADQVADSAMSIQSGPR